MSGDRLAEIEAELREAWLLTVPVHISYVNLEALVEIAKAARLIQVFDQAGGNDWWEAHAKLYAALARLDSGATEGDA